MSTTNSEKWGNSWGLELLFLFGCSVSFDTVTLFIFGGLALAHSRCVMHWGIAILLEWTSFFSPLWEVMPQGNRKGIKGKILPVPPPKWNPDTWQYLWSYKKTSKSYEKCQLCCICRLNDWGIILLVSEEFLKNYYYRWHKLFLFFYQSQSRTHLVNRVVFSVCLRNLSKSVCHRGF